MKKMHEYYNRIEFINMDEFYEKYDKEYNFLIENCDNVAGYDEAVNAFDSNQANMSLVHAYMNYTKDFISSDREAAAFMFAADSLGYDDPRTLYLPILEPDFDEMNDLLDRYAELDQTDEAAAEMFQNEIIPQYLAELFPNQIYNIYKMVKEYSGTNNGYVYGVYTVPQITRAIITNEHGSDEIKFYLQEQVDKELNVLSMTEFKDYLIKNERFCFYLSKYMNSHHYERRHILNDIQWRLEYRKGNESAAGSGLYVPKFVGLRDSAEF